MIEIENLTKRFGDRTVTFTGVQSFVRWASEVSGDNEPTIRDMAWVMEGANRVVGLPRSVRRQRSTQRCGMRFGAAV